MNKDRIAELLKEPARVAREDLAGLRELKQRYPWFSGAHLLLAIGEQAAGEVLFDDTLRTTAAHVPSREVLWEKVEDRPTDEAPPAPVEAKPVTVDVPAPRAKAPQPVAPPPTDEEIAQRILDQQILEAAASSAYAMTGPPVPPVAPAPVIEAPIPAPAPVKAAALKVTEIAPVAEEKPLPALPDRSPKRFTSWLDQAPSSEEPAMPFASEEIRSPGAADWLRTSDEGPAQGSAPSTPELTRDLIDRFLKQTTPEPKKTGFFTPQQAGKRSVEEQLDVVTETLARIHEKQGHWAKAAEAYERLAARHPEKSGYFAALAKKALRNLNT